MRFTLDNLVVNIGCPACGCGIAKTIRWLKAHDAFDCPECGVTTKLDTSELNGPSEEFDAKINAAINRRRGTVGEA